MTDPNRITALTELAKGSPEDLFVVVDDPDVAGKKTRKMGFGTFLRTYNRSAGEIAASLSNDDLDFSFDHGNVPRYGASPSATAAVNNTGFQAAFDSTAKVTGTPGDTYTINGGLSASTAGQVIDFSGSTIILAASQLNTKMLSIIAADVLLQGGTWDGNRANNTGGTQANSFGISVDTADHVIVNRVHVKSVHGRAIGSSKANYFTVHRCNVEDFGLTGIYAETGIAGSGISIKGIYFTRNLVDCTLTDIVLGSVGIQIFTLRFSGGSETCTSYRINNNDVLGHKTTTGANPVNIACRGDSGEIKGNYSINGSIGISNGGEDSQIIGNRVFDTQGALKGAIECEGKNGIYAYNIIKRCDDGFFSSLTTEGSSWHDNNLSGIAKRGWNLQADFRITDAQRGGQISGKKLTIKDNELEKTGSFACVALKGHFDGTEVSGNTFRGDNTGTGVSVDTDKTGLSSDAFLYATNNVFENISTPLSLFSTNATITGVSAAAAAVITISEDHGLKTNDVMKILVVVDDGPGGDLEAAINGNTFVITVLTTTTFSIPLDTSVLTNVYASGGTATKQLNHLYASGNTYSQGTIANAIGWKVSTTQVILGDDITDEFNVDVVTATNVITVSESGKTFYLDDVGGFTSTLPAPKAGLKYTFIVKTAPTTDYILTTNNGDNIFQGSSIDTIGELVAIKDLDTFTFVGTVSVVGDSVEVESDGTNWYCKATSLADGGITASVT